VNGLAGIFTSGASPCLRSFGLRPHSLGIPAPLGHPRLVHQLPRSLCSLGSNYGARATGARAVATRAHVADSTAALRAIAEKIMLEPMPPREAVTEYLEDKKTELADTSHQNHRYRLQRFLEWADETGLDDMNEITGRKLHRYKQWRAEDVNNVTLKNQLGTVRQFLAFCERINAAPDGVHEKLTLPTIGHMEDVRTDKLSPDEANAILEYCEKFEYATLRHAAFYLMWHTGIRSGAVRALDIRDYYSDEQYLAIQNRPEAGTRIKNRGRGEREINLKHAVCDVLDDYLDRHHPHVEDDHGRMPLFGTSQGRIYKTTLQRNIYTLTRPCHYLNECPHDRDFEACEATSYNTASKCPSSVSPHAVRRGAITAHRNANVPKEIASDRMDVSPDVLDKHYDQATESERRERRQEFLEGI
jgi:site-specific recombinase XerD